MFAPTSTATWNPSAVLASVSASSLASTYATVAEVWLVVASTVVKDTEWATVDV